MKDAILVSSSGSQTVPAKVLEFPPRANGDVSPTRAISSTLVTASGIAHDADGYLYVASPVIKSVTVFPPGADGDVPPFARLRGKSSALTNPQGVAIRDGKLYIANGPFGPGAPGTPSIAVFRIPLAKGTTDMPPDAVIAGPATGLDSPFGIAIDPSGNVYAANLNNTVTVYAPPTGSTYAAPTNTAPILTISTGLAGPEGLAIFGTTLYVSNDNNSITTYSLPAGAPGSVIAGPNTALDRPLGIDVDWSGNIFVVNTANQILKFAAGASGDTPPIAMISGGATTLNVPQFVSVEP